jgi:UDP-GlcNAc3NAcA epimerase
MPKVLTVVGNRPQFIKLGVTARALREMGDSAPFDSVVVNTGQHYDSMLADVFFAELQIEPPQYSLGIGSGQIVDQVGKMLQPIREIVEDEKPDAVLVFGDTNSTLAAAIVAAHGNVPLVHVEGGERLYRRAAMPEEVNRVVTDHLADLLLASSRKAVPYLMREGMGPDRVRFVGDPMYDIFKLTGETLRSRRAAQPADYGLDPGQFAIATMHRAENTDSREAGIAIMAALDAARMPVLLPAHPRLKQRLEAWGWAPSGSLKLVEPLGYFDFQSLLRQSALVVTDSGGVGREAFFAGKGAIVPLESSAWIEAVEAGMSTMVGSDPELLAAALRDFAPREPITGFVEQEFGSGDAGTRIVEAVATEITGRRRRAEGPWHPVARFGALPRAIDSTERTHDRFRRQVATVAAAHGLTFDLSRSLGGAVALGQIAAQAGVSGRLLLPLDRLAFNPFAEEASAIVQELLNQGHRLLAGADHGHREALAAQFATKVETTDAITPDDGDDTFEADGVVRPWLWGKTPLSPFERRLRLIDAAREAALDGLRREFAAPTSHDHKALEPVG